MQLSDLLRSARHDANGTTLDVGDDWLQGRSVFGGLQAALALLAMRQHVPAALPLRALQISFVAPVPAGEVRASARVLRVGRNVTHVEARLGDAEATLAVFVGVFGDARESAIDRRVYRPAPGQTHPRPLPFVPGLSPAFVQHFDARWLDGGFPFTASPVPRTVVEVDLRDSGPCDESALLAIADFIPPVALSMLRTPVPGSSLTWMLETMPIAWSELPLQGWRVDSEMIAAQDGYTSQSNRIWAPDGRLAALSRQSMVVFG